MVFDKLYRKDANGAISVWEIQINEPLSCDSFTGKGQGTITIKHGKLGGKLTIETINTNRALISEAKSRYTAKLKQGYKAVTDIKDNTPLPVKESDLESYLRLYLPDNRTTADGSLLAMLAKVYDNTNNKLFKNVSIYLGQWKINGLRCFIRAVRNDGDLFNPIKFTFQSREGTYWNTLNHLSDYLLKILPAEFITMMIVENWILDGELYIPGFSINQLNHIIKDSSSPYNKYVQFWCYDMYIEDTIQINRFGVISRYLGQFGLYDIKTKEDHLNIKSLFNVLPSYTIIDNNAAISRKNQFIDLGFEGLIMRDPQLEYAAGKRKMIKFKSTTDGVFRIIDIIPEGIKRPDIAKFVCVNDINDETFECKLSESIDFQKHCLKYKEDYIGKTLFITYGERAGVKKVPFHLKTVVFNE